jgi:hypothetical protein
LYIQIFMFSLYFLADINAARLALPNKTFWVTLLYSLSSFILFFSVYKLPANKTPTII